MQHTPSTVHLARSAPVPEEDTPVSGSHEPRTDVTEEDRRTTTTFHENGIVFVAVLPELMEVQNLVCPSVLAL